MKSLVTALLLCSQSDATLEETSLMQGLVARRGQMTPEASTKAARKDATAKLMETATKMMKNGATPDVITFIETTITEVNRDVLGVIVEEHHRDQELINDLLARFDAAIAAMEACAASVQQQHVDRMSSSHAHQLCRSSESIDCARSRKCEEELEEFWSIVKIEEEEMRRIHWEIHGQWCVGPAPPHPGTADPFRWTFTDASEGAETSESVHPYPAIDLAPDVIDFRRFSVEYFGLYIIQKPRVELAWENYNRKLLECAALEETWTLKVDDCDELQTTLHDQACEHAASNRQCASNFGHEYHMTLVAYTDAVATIRQLEFDRKREWETLHIVTCLLETVYTHVIHSIDSGEPCPTTESHPDQTVAEINTCHIIEESMTANLTIDYGTPPPPPELPPVVEPPCTAQYIWDETGSFAFEIQSSHSQTIADEGLGSYFTVLSAFGWAGCAAPKACTPCESTELVPVPGYTENEVCKEHHGHLHPGQMDWDTFKCLSGDECIRATGRCNGAANCDDESDELGCDTHWGIPAVLGAQECQEPFVSDVQFRCADNTCTHVAGRCNGVNNCADGSDEQGCATTTTGLTLEAMTGFTATIETPAVNSAVFYDRTYTFDSLGSFTGHSFIKMSNEDKHIRHSHVQMKLRLPQPLTVYVAKLDGTELPWLQAEGYTLTHLEGISYHGVRQTRHTDWSGELHEDHYGPGAVWQKTFAAGAIQLRGNNGGDGSYVMFVANPANPPTPPANTMPGSAEYIGCFVDDSARDLGSMVGVHTNAATNTFDLCRAACGDSRYMSLQWGGECFCADAYGTAAQYVQVDDSECNVEREPCTPNSHNCGGTWRQAIYEINHAAYHYGAPAGNTCSTSLDVSEADCLAAVQHLLPYGQAQGRTNLVAGSWGWVPPGCSVQSHFTHGQNGDWAAHYNRGNGDNDGGYTPVCESHSPVFSTALADTKCPHEHGDRLFRTDGSTLDQCYAECATNAGCNHFSWGTYQGGYVCMGCTTLANAQTHEGFTAYDMNFRVAPGCDAIALMGGGIHTDGVPDGASAIQFIDLGTAMPSSGQMQSVRYRVARANQAGMKFQVYRPVSGNTYNLVMESAALASPDQGSTITHNLLATPLEYQAGDYIGWVHTGQGTFNFHGSSGSVRWRYGIQPVGSNIDFNGSGRRTYSYEATMALCDFIGA